MSRGGGRRSASFNSPGGQNDDSSHTLYYSISWSVWMLFFLWIVERMTVFGLCTPLQLWSLSYHPDRPAAGKLTWIDDLLLECGSWLRELIAEQNSEWTSSITLCHALLSSWTWPPVKFSYVHAYERGHRKCLGGVLTKSMSYLTKTQSNDILNYQLGMLVTTLAWGNCCLQACSSFFSLAPLLWFF